MRSRRRPDGGDGGGGEGETFSRAPMPEASPAQQAAIAMVAIRLRNHPVGGWVLSSICRPNRRPLWAQPYAAGRALGVSCRQRRGILIVIRLHMWIPLRCTDMRKRPCEEEDACARDVPEVLTAW